MVWVAGSSWNSSTIGRSSGSPVWWASWARLYRYGISWYRSSSNSRKIVSACSPCDHGSRLVVPCARLCELSSPHWAQRMYSSGFVSPMNPPMSWLQNATPDRLSERPLQSVQAIEGKLQSMSPLQETG